MPVPDTARMRAVEIASPGGPEVLRLTERPVPVAGRGEVLIRVMAAGVNRPDVLQRQGRYPPPPGASDVPGLEVAGTIVSTGPGVTLSAGDPVCALVTGGGYAEFCAAPAAQCLPVPPGVDLVAAAGIPETYFTVWTNVFGDGRLTAGERLLVHGGASGIGTTAIQLARAFGARVFATAGSDDKCRRCEALGAERAVNYRSEDFVRAIKEATHGEGVDVVLDMVGGDYLPRNIAVMASGGRLVQIGLLGGAEGSLPLAIVMRKRLVLTGSTLRTRSVAEKGAIANDLRTLVWPRLARGEARPVIHSVWPLDRVADAHRLMDSGEHVGKIVLEVAGPAPG